MKRYLKYFHVTRTKDCSSAKYCLLTQIRSKIHNHLDQSDSLSSFDLNTLLVLCSTHQLLYPGTTKILCHTCIFVAKRIAIMISHGRNGQLVPISKFYCVFCYVDPILFSKKIASARISFLV